MCKSDTSGRDPDPPPDRNRDVTQLLVGLERQRDDLGPIADELIDLLRDAGHAESGKPARYPA